MPPKAEVDWPKLGNGGKLNLQDGVFKIPKGVLEAPNAGVLEEPRNSAHVGLVKSEAGLLGKSYIECNSNILKWENLKKWKFSRKAYIVTFISQLIVLPSQLFVALMFVGWHG